jgi:glycosyltransferase involved in cell wall biosynthesis
VAPQPFYSDRGTPIAVRHVLQALSEGGHEVDVVTYPIGRDLDIEGVRYFRCANPLGIRHVPVGFSWRKVVLDLLLVATMYKRLRRSQYISIHAVEELAFPAIVLGHRFGVPVLYDMQSSLPEQLERHRVFRNGLIQSVLKRCEAWLLRRADRIVCSAGLGARVRRIAPGAVVREWRYPSAVVQVPADEVAAVRDRLGIARDRRVVLYCGTFESYQNLGELLEVMPRVRADFPETMLVLVGADTEAAGALARQAAGMGLEDCVRIVERQPQERIPAYLAVADVLVSLRAFGDNLPLKIFDYMAAGKPIVTTPNCGESPILTPDRAVIVTGGTEDLAVAITGLLKDRRRAARLGRNARAYARRNFDWSRFASTVGSLTGGPRPGEPPRGTEVGVEAR